MNFRNEVRQLSGSPYNEEVISDLFDKHVVAWHDGESKDYIWKYLGVTLEEYSDFLLRGDGLQEFFNKVRSEN